MFVATPEQTQEIAAVANRINDHVCRNEQHNPAGVVMAGMCAAFVAEASLRGVSLDDMLETVRRLYPAIKAWTQ